MARLQKKDLHEIQTFVDLICILQNSSHNTYETEQRQQSYEQKKALEKAGWNTVNLVIELTQIHTQSLPTMGFMKQVSPNCLIKVLSLQSIKLSTFKV